MNKGTGITLAMLETLAGHEIIQKFTAPKLPSKKTKQIKTGMRNKICLKCKHKHKKCSCE